MPDLPTCAHDVTLPPPGQESFCPLCLRAEVARLKARPVCPFCAPRPPIVDMPEHLRPNCHPTDLQRKALARLPYTEAEAENLYRGVGNATWPPSSGWPALIREILASHERLRAELNGATTLLAEAEAEIARLRARFDQTRAGVVAEYHEIEQLLGKALGYPPLYPAVSQVDDGSVGVGDHTAVTLAMEASGEITRLRDYVGGNMLLSDFACADDMRRELEASRAEITRLRAALADAPADY